MLVLRVNHTHGRHEPQWTCHYWSWWHSCWWCRVIVVVQDQDALMGYRSLSHLTCHIFHDTVSPERSAQANQKTFTRTPGTYLNIVAMSACRHVGQHLHKFDAAKLARLECDPRTTLVIVLSSRSAQSKRALAHPAHALGSVLNDWMEYVIHEAHGANCYAVWYLPLKSMHGTPATLPRGAGWPRPVMGCFLTMRYC